MKALTVTFRGWWAVALLAGLIVIPQLLAGRLTEEQARELVLQYRRSMIAQQQMSELKAAGKESPDLEMATRWERSYRLEEQRKLTAVAVKRAWVVWPIRRRPSFVIRGTWTSETGRAEIHYYSLRSDFLATMRESSEARWNFPI